MLRCVDSLKLSWFDSALIFDSFPTLFDFIDDSPNESVDDLTKKNFEDVTDKCTLCDMCFMTKCPYVPPHEFNIDFPHLMLRYRTYRRKSKKIT